MKRTSRLGLIFGLAQVVLISEVGGAAKSLRKPLLKVAWEESLRIFFPDPSAPLRFEEGAAVIATNGEYLETLVSAIPANQGPYVLELSCVAGSKQRATNLKVAMSEVKIGLQQSCRLATGVELPEYVRYQFTWFGKNGRRNDFSVATDASLPDCSGVVEDLVEAVRFALAFDGGPCPVTDPLN